MVLEKLFQRSQLVFDQQKEQEVVYAHCGLKGAQLGLIFSPLVALLSFFRKSQNSFLVNNYRYSKVGFLIGIGLIEAMCYFRINPDTKEKNQSRAWRILGNQGQIRMDNYFVYGFAIGSVLFPLTRIVSLLGGGFLGAQLGLLTHVGQSVYEKKIAQN